MHETILKLTKQSVRIIPEQNCSDPLFARSNQDCAERGLSDCEPNFFVSSTFAELGRCHAEHVGRFLVETSTRIVASVVDRLSNAATADEPLPNLARAMLCRIIFRRKTRHRLDNTLKISCATADRD